MATNTPINWSTVPDLPAVASAAKTVATPGDIVLFSPGFASFSQYTNEYERNDAFLELVTVSSKE